MSPTLLIRWSGLGPMVAGLLYALFPLVNPNHDAAGYQSAIWVPAHLMPNLGALGFSLGDVVGMSLGLGDIWVATSMLFAVAQGWLGYALWSGATDRQPVQATARRVKATG